MTTKRLLYPDILRILATFAMVMLHVAADKWHTVSYNSSDWQIMNMYDAGVRWCVPIFIMLSGMFFLNPEKELTTRKIYTKHILRVFTALVFWGLAYQLFKLYRCSWEIIVANIPAMFYKIFFGIPRYHLWFLYTIIGLYMITPPLRIFISNCKRKDIEYVLWLFFIVGTTFPFINAMFKITDFPYSLNKLIPECTGYVGYYIAGYYFSTYELQKKHTIGIYIAGAVSILFTILFTGIVSLYVQHKEGAMYDYLLPNAMFAAFAIFIALKNACKTITLKNPQIIYSISMSTFGIYLMHDFFIRILLMAGISSLSFSPLISIPALSILIFTLSYLVTSIIRKIPILKNYIV